MNLLINKIFIFLGAAKETLNRYTKMSGNNNARYK